MDTSRRIRASIAVVLGAALVGALAMTTVEASAASATLQKPASAIAAVPNGFVFAARDGGVFTGGQAGFYGGMANQPLQGEIVGIAATPGGDGYWLLGSDGGVFSFPSGVLPFYGSAINMGKTFVSIVATPSGHGYWLAASDGTIVPKGDAGSFGDASGFSLQAPVVGMAATPSGNGYWLLGADGGIFAFGDAPFVGNLQRSSHDVTGMAATVDGQGYWLVVKDGGIFAFGDAPFLGNACCNEHEWVGIATTHSGHGYWMVATDGTVKANGDVTDPPPPPPPPTRQQIVDAAEAQVGTTGDLDGANPYGPDDKWSALFASSVWRTTGVPIPTNYAYGGDIATWANSMGQWKPGPANDPEPGDIAVYGTTSDFDADGWLPGVARVGIVESVDPDGAISTIEGNLPVDDGTLNAQGCVKHASPHLGSAAMDDGWPANVVGYASPLPLSAVRSVRSPARVDDDNGVHPEDWEGRDPHTAPGAPTHVHAAAGAGRATISFVAPGFDGDNATTTDITSYSVVTLRAGQPVGDPITGSASPIVVDHLHNGTSYQFQVTATGTFGTSVPSARSHAIVPALPVISSVTPASVGRGATHRTVLVDGSTFEPGALATVVGTGVTVESTTFVNSTRLRVVVSVVANAPVGTRALRVTNPSGGHAVCSCLAVDAAPVATRVTPDTVARSTTGITLRIRGSGFAPGIVAKFSAAVHVVSITFVDASHLQLTVDVSPSARRGAYPLTLVNADGGTSTAGAVTVT